MIQCLSVQEIAVMLLLKLNCYSCLGNGCCILHERAEFTSDFGLKYIKTYSFRRRLLNYVFSTSYSEYAIWTVINTKMDTTTTKSCVRLYSQRLSLLTHLWMNNLIRSIKHDCRNETVQLILTKQKNLD